MIQPPAPDGVSVRRAMLKTQERLLKAIPQAWSASSCQTKSANCEAVLTTIAGFATLSTYPVQLAALGAITQLLLSFLPPDGDKESTASTIETRIWSIVLQPICTSLENMKYSSIREEAFKCSDALIKLTQHGLKYTSEQIASLVAALRSSELSLKKSEFHDRVATLINLTDAFKDRTSQ
uniref:Uncharacterized protein n=1 Tax=Ciona savignyi TaxID=51511 RepID=H2ZN58_CIOSA